MYLNFLNTGLDFCCALATGLFVVNIFYIYTLPFDQF